MACLPKLAVARVATTSVSADGVFAANFGVLRALVNVGATAGLCLGVVALIEGLQ